MVVDQVILTADKSRRETDGSCYPTDSDSSAVQSLIRGCIKATQQLCTAGVMKINRGPRRGRYGLFSPKIFSHAFTTSLNLH